ncbi:formimidoylglutamate deiminase [Aureimonas fodinaquatilis]|uniref:Formimidoylglutamate deiminase n=1 Tax=Aureimonas fodinaquatilis TaxID=2565783 RepID=A0A5B0DSB2_9HYPH|nr:formimidoylglutamate deiminase [Aureimonas fodinaquatilis]KAA0969396.1 formimidoylglutamate deiminase [Aureimonas fodinaquatilis]
MKIRAQTALLPDGWAQNVVVSVDSTGHIRQVTPDGEPGSAYGVDVLLPALSNVHSHTFQRAMAGLTERRGPEGRDSFWTWRVLMFRFLDVLEPDEVEAIAAFAFMEMLEAGFGSVAEFHYLHHAQGGQSYDDIGELSGRIFAAAATSGIGLTMLPVLYEQGGLDGRPLAGGQQRFGNDLARFEKLLSRIQSQIGAHSSDTGLGIAPHSLRAVPPEHIEHMLRMLPQGPVHMHIAEQEQEIVEVEGALGQRPVDWLTSHCEVNSRWCLIHATHMTEQETANLARSGAVAGLCPVTEANLGDGIFNAVHYLEAEGRFGIGSDSNIRISTVEELRQLEYSQRLLHRQRAVLAPAGGSVGRTLYDGALAGGAQALGRPSGSIQPGMLADMIALDASRFAGFAQDDGILDGFLFTGDKNAVMDVWSAGRHMVRRGRHIRRKAIAKQYEQTLSKVRQRL